MSDDFDWDDEQEVPPASAPKRAPAAPARPILPDGGGDGGDDSVWLTSYADLMTLIACFFILLVAFANYDPAGFQQKANELAKHFSAKKIQEQDSKLSQLVEELQKDPVLRENTQVKLEDTGVVINFSGTALFEPGKADIRPEVLDALDIMITLIQEKNPKGRVLVEGHTDDTPMLNSSKFVSNWELSGARAARVVQRFEEFGIDPTHLASVGYGSTRPMLPNHDETGQAIPQNMNQNRRVVIKVLDAPMDLKRIKLGLGVYFDENAMLEPNKASTKP